MILTARLTSNTFTSHLRGGRSGPSLRASAECFFHWHPPFFKRGDRGIPTAAVERAHSDRARRASTRATLAAPAPHSPLCWINFATSPVQPV